MSTIKITASDVRECVGVTRSDLQRWLSTLPPFATDGTEARHARQFQTTDLIFLLLIKALVKDIGLKLDVVASFSNQLHEQVSSTSFVERRESAEICLSMIEPGMWRLTSPSSEILSLTLRLQPAREIVYRFLGVEAQSAQRDLPLGFVVVGNRRAGGDQ
ncbi:hypothetical protein RI103_18280 [Paraburkholderia sp. FT54]|uniref:hypothetical protein n=1 Tax=Paraburkholderia sp. FT54 TaxID=3074437 RepID=UPI002877B28A|nr:hypothetical protein [Paraburkholderia sp. FT54]WNC89598.1 hypothetical protein RI103_18280 [Paraburkholderia sp. FT54]